MPQSYLTRTPAPSIDWDDEGTPRSAQFGDIYFSVDGGLAETRLVFLKGCGLEQSWQGASDRARSFRICETGFGSGLNFLAALQLWQASPAAKAGQHLHYISIEAMPWSQADLERGLAKFPQLAPIASALLAQWPGPVKGVHRLHFKTASLTLYHMPAAQALPQMDMAINAWFLDGFSPSKNPDMWSDNVLSHLGRLSAPGARLATFSVAGTVRRGLEAAGFQTQKEEGFGRKRHRLEAVYSAKPRPKGAACRKPLIIGGGISGSSIAAGFGRLGVSAKILDPAPDLSRAASGNPAALITPRLDVQDRPESRFYLSAYLYAQARYRASGAQIASGNYRFARTEKDAARYKQLSQLEALPPEQMRWAEHVDMGPHINPYIRPDTSLGAALGFGGLNFPGGLLIDPVEYIKTVRAPHENIACKVIKISAGADGIWHVHADNGQVYETDALFLCGGAEIEEIDGVPDMSLRYSRGQVVWHDSELRPKMPVNYGGYAADTGEHLMLGTSHAHTSAGFDGQIHARETADILSRFTDGFQTELPPANTWQARASVRVHTRDTLPIACAPAPNLYMLSGLGARGFMLAPLLGEYLASHALNEPVPLEAETVQRFGARSSL